MEDKELIEPHFCPFCEIADNEAHERIIASNHYAYVIYDNYPVNKGHSLVIPKRHVRSFFDLYQEEQIAVMKLLAEQRQSLHTDFSISDCNVGLNDGPLAGQTVPHCHVHIIPRYEGDVDDPRGGIRWVIPDKAKYWND